MSKNKYTRPFKADPNGLSRYVSNNVSQEKSLDQGTSLEVTAFIDLIIIAAILNGHRLCALKFVLGLGDLEHISGSTLLPSSDFHRVNERVGYVR